MQQFFGETTRCSHIVMFVGNDGMPVLLGRSSTAIDMNRGGCCHNIFSDCAQASFV